MPPVHGAIEASPAVLPFTAQRPIVRPFLPCSGAKVVPVGTLHDHASCRIEQANGPVSGRVHQVHLGPRSSVTVPADHRTGLRITCRQQDQQKGMVR